MSGMDVMPFGSRVGSMLNRISKGLEKQAYTVDDVIFRKHM